LLETAVLQAAHASFPDAVPLLITLDVNPPTRSLPVGLTWMSAVGWLMEGQ